MLNKYYLIIPAYNEEGNIEPCFSSIAKAVSIAKPKYKLKKTYVCVNGCTDYTEQTVQISADLYPDIKIKILHSPKGMVRALGRIVNSIPDYTTPIVKIDADTKVHSKAILILLEELEKHPELQIVGGQPEALPYKGKSLYKKLLSSVLDIRSRYPMSQVAEHDVANFHKIADKNPQPVVLPSFEKKSRIYFHGRFYVLRNKRVWRVPTNCIGDDTYLTLDTYKRFGLSSIRIRYDALCYYYPSTSLTGHWKAYKRIFCDTHTLFKLPEFKQMERILTLEKVKLDWEYIRTLSVNIRLSFVFYSIIKRIENILFRISPKYSEDLWVYESKKV